MVKSNLKISRTITVNCGNYESIKPSIELEVLDVPVDKVDTVYASMSDVLDNLFQLEQANLYVELKEIRDSKIYEHIKSIVSQDFDQLRKGIKMKLLSIEDMING